MERKDIAWKDEKLSTEYLEEILGAAPLVNEQIEIIQRIVKKAVPNAKRFLDLGCGDGRLGACLIDIYPEAKGHFLDFSQTMIDVAKEKISVPHVIAHADYSTPAWLDVTGGKTFDIVISGLSIHHQHDARKKEIYKEIYEILSPGGIFLNLEHVASKSEFGKDLFVDTFVDNLKKFNVDKKFNKTGDEIFREFKQRDEDTNMLTTVEEQCAWLEEIGFSDVDCFFKLFEIALFGGIKRGDRNI